MFVGSSMQLINHGPLTAAPSFTFSGQTVTKDANGNYVVEGQTLTAGGAAVTVSGTVISLASDAEDVVIGGSTQHIASGTIGSGNASQSIVGYVPGSGCRRREVVWIRGLVAMVLASLAAVYL